MKVSLPPPRCYIAGIRARSVDNELARLGVTPGVLCFCLPEMGILFRCRADGSAVELEFAALFAALEFFDTKLEAKPPDKLRVLSSSANFVFAFWGDSPILAPGSDRRKLLDSYRKKISLEIGYVKSQDNRALIPSPDLASLPADAQLPIKLDKLGFLSAQFRPIQRGIKV